MIIQCIKYVFLLRKNSINRWSCGLVQPLVVGKISEEKPKMTRFCEDDKNIFELKNIDVRAPKYLSLGQ